MVHQWEVYTPWGTVILPLDQNYSKELLTTCWQRKSVWLGITQVAISLPHHFRIPHRADHASSSHSLKQHQESHCQQQTLPTVSHPVRGETRRPSHSYPLHPVHRATPKTTGRTGHQKSITLWWPTADKLHIIHQVLLIYKSSLGAKLNSEKLFIITCSSVHGSLFPVTQTLQRYLSFHISPSGTLLLPLTLINECCEAL